MSWADLWADVAAEAFLSSYVATAGSSGLVPEPARFSALLRFFLIQKSAGDLARELEERPAWIHIPLMTLASLARGSGGSIT